MPLAWQKGSPMSHGGWAAADAAINRQPAQNAKLIKCENEKRLVFLAAQSWFDHVGPVCVGEFPHQSSGSRRCVSGVSPPVSASMLGALCENGYTSSRQKDINQHQALASIFCRCRLEGCRRLPKEAASH